MGNLRLARPALAVAARQKGRDCEFRPTARPRESRPGANRAERRGGASRRSTGRLRFSRLRPPDFGRSSPRPPPACSAVRGLSSGALLRSKGDGNLEQIRNRRKDCLRARGFEVRWCPPRLGYLRRSWRQSVWRGLADRLVGAHRDLPFEQGPRAGFGEARPGSRWIKRGHRAARLAARRPIGTYPIRIGASP